MVPSALSTPCVYVGIVTYNSLADLPICLHGLAAQTYANIRILILDNASTDQTVSWLHQQGPHIPLLLNEQNAGFARAHNQIVAHCAPASHEFYMPLNPDVELTPGYITTLVNLLQQTKGGWGTGKLLLLDDTGSHQNIIYSVGHGLLRGGYTFNIGYLMKDDGQFDSAREVFGAPGAAPLISGQLITAVAPDGNLFDPDMFFYGEDTDLDWRARRQDWRCWYTPHAVAYHRGSRPSDSQRDGALINRYLSVIKNAYLIDLITYNLPLMTVHCLIRLFITPRSGLRIVYQLLRVGPKMGRKRQKSAVNRDVLNTWFRWSAAQPTAQPLTGMSRLRTFIRFRVKY